MKLRTVAICLLLLLGVLVMGMVSPSNGGPQNPYRFNQCTLFVPAAGFSSYEATIAARVDATYLPDDGRQVVEKIEKDNMPLNPLAIIHPARNVVDVAIRLKEANDKLAAAKAKLDAANANLPAAKDKLDVADAKLKDAEAKLNAAQANFNKAFAEFNAAPKLGTVRDEALKAAEAARKELAAARREQDEASTAALLAKLAHARALGSVNDANEHVELANKAAEDANKDFDDALKAAQDAKVDPKVIDAAKKAVNADPAKLHDAIKAAEDAFNEEDEKHADDPGSTSFEKGFEKACNAYVDAFVAKINSQ